MPISIIILYNANFVRVTIKNNNLSYIYRLLQIKSSTMHMVLPLIPLALAVVFGGSQVAVGTAATVGLAKDHGKKKDW